jgi:hypothetical protein
MKRSRKEQEFLPQTPFPKAKITVKGKGQLGRQR